MNASPASSGAAPIRVFLLDDHELVRRGLQDLLSSEPDMTVVGEAADARQALARAPALRPDVAVLDVRLGSTADGADQDGISVCRDLRVALPDLVCLMLTSFDDDEALFDAIMAGAAGYVLKQIRGSDLVTAIRTVAAGKSMLDPGATARVLARVRGPADHTGTTGSPELARLSPREREILDLIGEGLTNRQIAERLYLAEKTVKNRISAILTKLKVGRRIQAAVIAERVREREESEGIPRAAERGTRGTHGPGGTGPRTHRHPPAPDRQDLP
ncbi:response regulator transcription factor [Streptomyces purpurogeneiscleroticus]|uniref:response regulator transcription factor n=1 Tax=Streptomyces purpurogeneiscleroticus TaxID=68259 RepID=UPI0027E03A06|nr:response regulator transcription factor [Streptomyces purpurogeneiscleroticus]MBZ4018753.1 DNA-binding response regulator [Streptomyces purpurogeneiscleroticus]